MIAIDLVFAIISRMLCPNITAGVWARQLPGACNIQTSQGEESLRCSGWNGVGDARISCQSTWVQVLDSTLSASFLPTHSLEGSSGPCH